MGYDGVCGLCIEPRKNVELLSWPVLRDERWTRLHPERGAQTYLDQCAFIVSNNQGCAVAKRDRAEFYFFHESADRLSYFRKGKDSEL